MSLYFAETFPRVSGPGQRVFSFNVNGKDFSDFDIWKNAGGPNRVYIESVPVEVINGELQISFTAQVENSAIKAIEIIPRHESAKADETIRINAGASTAYIDSAGHVWQPDQGFEGGRVNSRSHGLGPGSVAPPSDGFIQLFLNRDTDESGGIGENELPEALQFLIPRLDQDGDGELGNSEVMFLAQFLHYESDGERLRDSLLQDGSPSAQTTQRLQEVLDAIDRVSAENASQIASVRRSAWYSYFFTVAAMMIAVVSFGHLLTAPPPRRDRWTEIDASPNATRSLIESLVLICALSFVDLFWTTVNLDGIHFQEMNPLGNQILLNGNSLAAFKAICVLTSIGLLFVLRKYKGAQLASWWVCMICTLVTFRWIVLDSAVLG